jgi:hypothetical protein
VWGGEIRVGPEFCSAERDRDVEPDAKNGIIERKFVCLEDGDQRGGAELRGLGLGLLVR